MTRLTLDPHQDLSAVSTATAEFLEAARGLDHAAVTEPSRLPNWTRGHVLSHLARQADSLVNLLTWARTGEETPQYPSARARDADIDKGAGRPAREQLADLRESADRFAGAARAMPEQCWANQVVLRSGKVVAAAELPWRRLVELLFHRVDLGIGYTVEQFPADFTDRALAALVSGLHAREGVAAVRLHDPASDERWDIGAAAEPEATVSGTRAALLGWVSGRTAGEGLSIIPSGALPKLPPLG